MAIKEDIQQSDWRTIGHELRPYRGMIILTLAVTIMKAFVDTLLALVLVPLFDALLGLDKAAEGRQLLPDIYYSTIDSVKAALGFESSFVMIFLTLVGLALIKCVLAIVFYFLIFYMRGTYERDKRLQLFWRALNVNWLYFTNQKVGHLMNAIGRETERSGVWMNNIFSFADFLATILFYAFLSIYISFTATCIMLVSLLVIALIVFPISRYARKLGKRLLNANQNLTHLLNEYLSSFKVVKGCRMEEAAHHFVSVESNAVRKLVVKLGIIGYLPIAILEPFILIIVIAFAIAVQKFQFISLSESAVIGVLFLRCFQRASHIQNLLSKMFEHMPSILLTASMRRSLEAHAEPRPDKNLDTFQAIDFDNLSFQYKEDSYALDTISFSVRRGEFVGIVGASGAGKTTLVDVLLAFLPPTTGCVCVNGESLQLLNPWHWRSRIGYVSQDVVLFNDTIRTNITLHRDMTDDAIIKAAKNANAHEFIQELSEGYDTPIGERGVKLSGGQKQRIAFARALSANPELLILDEATSAMDSLTESKIQRSVEMLQGQLTIISIAHRLSTVINADRIIVLDQGRIIESGSPAELLRTHGKFQEMYQAQTASCQA